MTILHVIDTLPVLLLVLWGDGALLSAATAAQQQRVLLQGSDVGAAAASAETQVEASAVSPAKHYPGWYGGGFYYHGKLLCRKQVCTSNLRTACIGHLSGCKSKRCRFDNAPNGAVCDVNPCIQGLCWNGVCMGGGPATCPSHPEQCMKYKCDPHTGMCAEVCPKPNGTPCWGGTCQAGKCVPGSTACPPDPNKCSKYKFNNATSKCELEVVTCPQQPPDACKMLKCKKATGLCTALWNRPNGTPCPGGKCRTGVCKASPACPTNCPEHNNTCKVYLCDPSVGLCTKEANKPDNTTCPGGTCKGGVCQAAPKCPTECPPNVDDCRQWECNLNTGKCDIEVNRPDDTPCPGPDIGFTCKNGVCLPPPICPICLPHPELCKKWACNSTTGQCDIEENKPDGTPCGEIPGPYACNGGGCLTWDCPIQTEPCMYWQWTTNISKPCIYQPVPDGIPCNDSSLCTANDACKAGNCTGTAVECPQTSPEGSCTEQSCDAVTGGCKDTPLVDGTPCRGGTGGLCNGTCSSSVCGNLTCP